MTLDELISQVNDRHPDGTALDRLAEATAVADRLGELADHLVGHFVDQARRTGASWTTDRAEHGGDQAGGPEALRRRRHRRWTASPTGPRWWC